MSEQKTTGFMHELDQWTNQTIIRPLYSAARYNSEDWDADTPQETDAKVRYAIREKVLESYRNGQAAAVRQSGKELR